MTLVALGMDAGLMRVGGGAREGGIGGPRALRRDWAAPGGTRRPPAYPGQCSAHSLLLAFQKVPLQPGCVQRLAGQHQLLLEP